MKRRKLLSVIGATIILASTPYVLAETNTFPERPIKVIVPYATGQSADIFARLLSLRMSEELSQSVVVENRGGGAGIPGMMAARDAPKDGYTLVIGGTGPISINPALYEKKLPYDPEKDFSGVHGLFLAPSVILAGPNSPINSFEQLVTAAKANSDAVQWGVAGIGTSQYLSGEMVKSAAKIDVTPVPYQGSGPMLNDLLGGQIHLAVDTVSAVYPLVRDGRLKALAITSKERIPQLPDVPTVSELGYPGFEAVGFASIFVPSGTPRERIEKLDQAIRKAMSSAEIQSAIADRGAIPDLRGAEGIDTFVREEIQKWGTIIRERNIQLN